ncbi:MAG TPA: RlpA-like double-psi beta-barrel domain-containing protein [Hyphomicrobiaceae bacterium]|nr:RlpA-like double-psi beta-barrel domain-containing protein [Hyphomicrobiaceae bacterium]
MHRVTTVLATAAFVFAAIPAATAKTPGRTYCFNGVCHTVKTLEETRRLVGKTTTVKASFYDDARRDRFNPSNLTSSGEYFRAWAPDNAASPIYPNGTKLLVWHPGTRKAVKVRINNAGPYWGDRKLDLSRAAAAALGMGGVATLHVRVVEAPTKAEATYSKGRSYAPVKGYMGQFASLDQAFAAAGGGAAPSAPVTAPVAVASATPSATPAKAASPARVTRSAAASNSATANRQQGGKVVSSETIIQVAGKGSTKLRPNETVEDAIRRLAAMERQKTIRVAQERSERSGQSVFRLR